MKDRNVQVLLKDGTYLKCVIYDGDDKYPVIDKERIDELFSNIRIGHENFMQELIHFQTDVINGKFHPANVLWYNVVDTSEEY